MCVIWKCVCEYVSMQTFNYPLKFYCSGTLFFFFVVSSLSLMQLSEEFAESCTSTNENYIYLADSHF